MLKILSWNIQQGGGTRVSKITKAIASINPDILVLSEFRNNKHGILLRTNFLKLGYHHHQVAKAKKEENSVIICSKIPFNGKQFPDSDPKYAHGVLKAEFDAFSLYGVYLPHKKKHVLFKFLLEELKESDKPCIIKGDYNSGINFIDQAGNSFMYSDFFPKANKLGYIDAFREKHGDTKEFSWYSHQGNGYRYDHTYIHEDLVPILTECYYLHSYREEKYADHSPMILELG